MLSFYRRVRKQLIEEGRLKKYVLYAGGEIILIVFGILIALQLNEWNSERKERLSEHAYYCKLLEDVIQDSIALEQMLAENAERILFSNEMLALLQQDKPDQKAIVIAMRGAISKITFTFKPTIAAFEDLKSSGNLKILRDQNIKNSVINYYTSMEGYVDVVDVNSDVSVARYYAKENVAEVGWQHIDFVHNAIDTSLVNIKLLQTKSYPSRVHRQQMMSDALFFIANNARIKSLYLMMQEEIINQSQLLRTKC